MKQYTSILLLLVLAAFWLVGCEHDTTNGPGDTGDQLTDKTCLGCHGSEAELKLALGEKSGSKVGVAIKADG
jgi:predicted small secreted protein